MAGLPGGIEVEQAEFSKVVGANTGIDPRVIMAWAGIEGAYAKNGTGGFNFLNLRPYSSDVGSPAHSSGGFDQFHTLGDAEASTIARIRQPFLQQFLSPVLKQPHPTPADEIKAIGQSGWDAGHYQEGGGGPGSSLAASYARLYGSGSLGKDASTKFSGGGNGLTNELNGATSAAGKAVDALNPFSGITSWIENSDNIVRIGMFIGGGILVLLGAYKAFQ